MYLTKIDSRQAGKTVTLACQESFVCNRPYLSSNHLPSFSKGKGWGWILIWLSGRELA